MFKHMSCRCSIDVTIERDALLKASTNYYIKELKTRLLEHFILAVEV